MLNGQGTCYFTNGFKATGNFINDKLNGEGSFTTIKVNFIKKN